MRRSRRDSRERKFALTNSEADELNDIFGHPAFYCLFQNRLIKAVDYKNLSIYHPCSQPTIQGFRLQNSLWWNALASLVITFNHISRKKILRFLNLFYLKIVI